MTDPVPTSVLDRDITELDAAALPAALSALPASVRLVRAGNPLRTPLTLQRLLIQAGHFDLGADLADALAAVAARHGSEAAVVLVIEQAETMDGALRPALQRAIDGQRFTGPTLHALLVHSRPAPPDLPQPELPASELPASELPASELPAFELPASGPQLAPASLDARPAEAVAAPALAVQPPPVQLPPALLAPAPTDAAVLPAPSGPPGRPSPAAGSLQAVAVQRDRARGQQARQPVRAVPVRWIALALVLAILIAGVIYRVPLSALLSRR